VLAGLRGDRLRRRPVAAETPLVALGIERAIAAGAEFGVLWRVDDRRARRDSALVVGVDVLDYDIDAVGGR
jgi:hypothetical protein